MVEKVEGIVEFFFDQIEKRGKYKVVINNKQAFIIPRDEERYYKPIIIVKRLDNLEMILYNYIDAVNSFYQSSELLTERHNTGYFFYNLFSNITNSDAMDLESYIEKRISFLKDSLFSEMTSPLLLSSNDNYEIYVQRKVAILGFESPYTLNFWLNIDEKKFNLPLIRYAIDEEKICHLFTVQFDRCEERSQQTGEYKRVINSVNSGIKKYRNVQPSFVFVLNLFSKMLEERGITNIVAADFLFSRYRRYYGLSSENKSNQVLKRILDDYMLLLQRMEYQFSYFEISNYPNEIDSYTHIKLKS